MLLSLYLALLFPFELFLFSYIVLGPLHYMTEISWLKDRDFFVRNQLDMRLLMILALSGILFLVSLDLFEFGILKGLTEDGKEVLQKLFVVGLFAALLVSLFSRTSFSKPQKILLTISCIGLGLFCSGNIWFVVIIGIFIPTLIHTTLFTGAFMLDGAMKSRYLMGYIAFFVFVMCNLFFFIYPGIKPILLESAWIQNLYLDSDMYFLNLNVYDLFYGGRSETFVLDSVIGTRIQAFIAFAYSYHYLNWFSKTEIIKWHRTPKPWLILSVVVWLSSIGLHLVDMKIGILFIASLSLLHVYLEFPLNHLTFQSIGRRIQTFVRS